MIKKNVYRFDIKIPIFMTIRGVPELSQGISMMNGPPDRSRTCDLCLRRASLYPAELRVVIGKGLQDSNR